MRAVFRNHGESRILEVTLSRDDVLTVPGGGFLTWRTLSTLVIDAFDGDESSRRRPVPLISIDLSEVAPHVEAFETWISFGQACRARFLYFVRDRSGKAVFHGLAAPAPRRDLLVARSFADAIESLRNHRAGLQATLNLTPIDALTRMGSPRLCLVGCPSRDLGTLPSEMENLGIEVVPVTSIQAGELVAFCISAGDGPTDGTRASIAALRGKTVTPLAVVLVHADVINDDSLRSLIDVEERELLMTVVPAETVAALPVLLDVDPALIGKLWELANAEPAPVRCLSDSYPGDATSG